MLASSLRSPISLIPTPPSPGHQAIAWLEEKLDHLDPSTSVFVNFNSGGFSLDAVHFSAMVSAYHVISHSGDCGTRGKEAAARAPKLHVHCFSPSGSTKQRPSSMAPYEKAAEILKGLNLDRIDFALVKGRARPQSAAALVRYVDANSRVLIHDWDDDTRKYYKYALDLYDEVDHVQDGKGLAVLKVKDGADKDNSLQHWDGKMMDDGRGAQVRTDMALR